MKSSLKLAVRNVGTALAGLVLIAATFVAFTSRAQALTVSIGTPTVVSSIKPDLIRSVGGADSRIHVVYSTSDATTFTIMFASNGERGAYTLTKIATGAVANKPTLLTVALTPDQVPHIYYYDASSQTINYLVGNTFNANPQFFLPSGVRTLNATGLVADVSGTGFLLYYTSLTVAGNYGLFASSITFGASADTFGAPMTIVSTAGIAGSGSLSSGQISAFTNSTNLNRSVVYFDDANSALRLAYISAGTVITGDIQTLDSASPIANIYATDNGDTTRIIYTLGSGSSALVKYIVQRRAISYCWYIQKIDDSGAVAQSFASGDNNTNGPTVSYLKSSNLKAAFGRDGLYFDDFSEGIIGQTETTDRGPQKGIATIATAVTSGGIWQNVTDGVGATRVLGYFVPSAGGLNSLNWQLLEGTVRDSFGNGFGSAKVRINVTDGGTGVAVDLNPASGETAGAITNAAGGYKINVASGATFVASVSSSPWVFVVTSSPSFTSTTTVVTGGGNVGAPLGATGSLDFVAISSPSLLSLSPSSGSVMFSATGGIAFTITPTSPTQIPANGFSSGMTAWLVPQTAKGTIATSTGIAGISTGTVNHVNAVLSQNQIITNGLTSGSFWSRFSSTDTALPVWYTLFVGSATPSGQWMVGSMVDAFQLRPVEIAVSSPIMAQTLVYPGTSVQVSSGLINTSHQTTFIIRSSAPYTNVFPTLSQVEIYLTTSTTIPGGLKYNSDIPLGTSFGATSTDEYGSGSQFFLATGSIFGADTSKSWYVRISSRPGNTNTDAKAQFAFGPAITLYSSSITNITVENGSDSTIVATGTIKLNVTGAGFVAGSTVTITTHTTLVTGLPFSPAGNVSAVTVFSSGTSMQVAINYINPALSNGPFYLYIASATGGSGMGLYDPSLGGAVGVGGIQGSTVIARGDTLITMATAAVTSITPSVVPNTRQTSISIIGRGLLGGSTVQFFSTDGTTATPVATVNEGSTLTGLTVLTANVDFRSSFFAPKTFSVRVTSITNTIVTASSISFITNPNVTLTCSSMTLSYVDLPWVSTAGVYNSTGYVTIGLRGLGLVSGASVTFSNSLFGSSQPIINNVTVVGSTSSYAVFTSTAFFGATAQSYTITVSSVVLHYGGDNNFIASVSTTITVLSAAASAATPNFESNYAPLTNASFTITGTGLLDNTSAELRIAGDSLTIGNKAIAAGGFLAFNTVNATSMTRTAGDALFDLSAASQATGGTTYNLVVTATCTTCGKGMTLGTIGVTINRPRIDAVNPTSISADNSVNAGALTLYGRGLTNNATIQFTYTGSRAAGNYFTAAGVAASTLPFTRTIAVTGGGFTTTGAVTNVTLPPTSTATIQTIATPLMPGSWTLTNLTQVIAAGTGGNGVGTTSGGVAYTSTGTLTFTVSDSSGPSVPTGLTVLSSGLKTVTLRWISPGNDGTIGNLTTGAGFVVYYSSAEDNRGQGCAPCYPKPTSDGARLSAGATNYTFAQTWSQFLPFGYAASAITTSNVVASIASSYYNTSTSTTRGLIVSTQTLALTAVTVKDSTSATGATGSSPLAPGKVVEATLSIDPGTKDGTFWFVVQAMDEAGNLSPTNVVYTTASAKILAQPGPTQTGGSPTIDPNASGSVSYSIPATVVGGVTLNSITLSWDAGFTDGADSFNTPVIDASPPADSPGVQGVGVALDITLASGKTEFKKPITITLVVDEGQLISALAGRPISLVKGTFFNGTKWVLVANSQLNPGGAVAVTTSHLTKYRVAIAAPATNLSAVTAYPNPYRPTLATHLAQGITIDGVPAGTDVKIYTMAGDLVKQLKDDNNDGIVNWDAKNENGQDVASGVYLVLLKGGGDSKSMKIAVQR